MPVDRETLVRYFAEKLGVPQDELIYRLSQPGEEYYDLEYYMGMAYGWHEISFDLIRELFLAYVPDPVGTVVDLGCGPGFYSGLLLERAKRYVGVDISESAVGLAQSLARTNPSKEYLVADGAALDLPEDSVDLIFCSEVIEHIPDNVPVFRSFRRILKPTGRVFLTTTTFYYYITHVLVFFGYKDVIRQLAVRRFLHRLRLYFRGFRGAEERTRFMKEGLDRDDHVHAFTFPQLEQLFAQTGFGIDRYDYFNCKDVFPGSRLFLPISWPLKKLFRTSRIYGPNIAVLLSPREVGDA